MTQTKSVRIFYKSPTPAFNDVYSSKHFILRDFCPDFVPPLNSATLKCEKRLYCIPSKLYTSTIIRDFKTTDKTIGDVRLIAPDKKEFRKLVDSMMSCSQGTGG